MNAYLKSQNAQAERDAKKNDNQVVFQAQMLEVVQKASQPQVKERDLNDLVENLRKRFPPEFYWTNDHADANEWTVQIEKIFVVFKFTGQ